MPEPYSELIFKTRRGSIEFSWSEGDLAIDAENSDERVMIFLSPTQAQQLFDYLKAKAGQSDCDHPFRVTGDVCLNCGEPDTGDGICSCVHGASKHTKCSVPGCECAEFNGEFIAPV